jgi:quercetin dioxygenase-like cupin family protein
MSKKEQKVFEYLGKQDNQPEMKFVPKGWGYELWIVNHDLYCGKLLKFVKGKKCSLHYHKNKDETFYIQSGLVKLYYTDDLEKMERLIMTEKNGVYGDGGFRTRDLTNCMQSVTLEKGENFYIPPGRVHQMVALQDTELFEFSTFHEDSDSYRLKKGDSI